jgi:hypothetical protein
MTDSIHVLYPFAIHHLSLSHSIYSNILLCIQLTINYVLCKAFLGIHTHTNKMLGVCYLSMALQPFVGPWPLFQFLNLYTVGKTPWTGDQPVARLLPTRRTTQTQNKRAQTSMPRVGFEPTIPVFERPKSVHQIILIITIIYLCWQAIKISLN